MSDLAQTNARAVEINLALSTMGACPKWDAAVTAYLAADALVHAEGEYGALAKASEALFRKEIGRPAMDAAERHWTDTYCRPAWQAARTLSTTPAPSLSAALFKSLIIEKAEVWNDADMTEDCMSILRADFARVAKHS